MKFNMHMYLVKGALDSWTEGNWWGTSSFMLRRIEFVSLRIPVHESCTEYRGLTTDELKSKLAPLLI